VAFSRKILVKKLSSRLVHSVGNSVSRVQFDGSQSCLTGSGGRGHDSGRSSIRSGKSGSSIRSKSVSKSGSGSTIRSKSGSVSVVQRSASQDGSGESGQRSGAGGGGPLGTGSGLVEFSLEFSLGGLDLGGVLDLGGASEVEDGLSKLSNGGDGEVGSLDPEAEGVSDVVGGLDLAVGINVGVRAGHASVGVADLVLLAVDVAVAVLDVAEFVLGLELAGGVGGGSGDNGDGGSSYGGSGIGEAGGGGIWEAVGGEGKAVGGDGEAGAIGGGEDLGLGSGHAGSQKNKSVHCDV